MHSSSTFSSSVRDVVAAARLSLLLWITAAVEGYVRRVYHARNPAVHRAPPSLSHHTASTRKYTVVSASAAWELMETARVARVNVSQAARVREDQPDLGCSHNVGESWLTKKIKFYNGRVSACFAQLMHWNMVADPGTHAYKEVMPLVLYGWEVNMACLPDFQFLLPGKVQVTNHDQLDEEVLPYAERMKLERVASYRQVQGPSNQSKPASKMVLNQMTAPIRQPPATSQIQVKRV